jgi:hypothetical protein
MKTTLQMNSQQPAISGSGPTRRHLMVSLLSISLLAACHSHTTPVALSERHMAGRSERGYFLYVDRADNRMVLQQASAATGHFSSFSIGWIDSLAATDHNKAADKERYFQYGIQNDWVALVDGDTLRPVFFQEKPSLTDTRREGILVFETSTGKSPDTLIYKDSFGAWGVQLFALNRK